MRRAQREIDRVLGPGALARALATEMPPEALSMLPVIFHLLDALRRALKRGGRSLFFIADVFAEARHDWRTAAKYPFAE